MISKFFIYRPVFATVLAVLLVVAGLVTLHTLPVAQFPDITPPTVQVTATYLGANAETVAQTVGVPIEEQVNGVDGMLYMSSTSSSSGEYTLTVTFELGTDVDMATVLVQNRVNIAQGSLPEAVIEQGIVTRKQSTNIVMFLSLTSDNPLYDGLYLSNYAKLNITDALTRLSGVGGVTVFGANDYSMRIWLDPEVMRIRGITPTDVYDAIAEQNIEVAAGTVGQPPFDSAVEFQFTLSTQGRLTTTEEFGNIVIRTLSDGSYLRVKDVATIELGSESYTVVSAQEQQQNAAIAIYQLPGSNSLDVASEVRAKMKELDKYLPDGVTYNFLVDTTQFVTASIEEVLITFLETLLLVVLVIFIFLQNFRAVIIPALTIPVSLIGTFAVMKLFGFSINTLTLFGLVLAIAIVVDDAIVVVENSSRLLATGKYNRKEAVTKAMGEITRPVIGVVLVLLAVFIPTAFIGGITGELYKQFALTIAVATVFSGFNSLTLTPALCALFLRPTADTPRFRPFRWFNKGYDATVMGYVSGVGFLLKRSWLTMAIFLVITLCTVYGFVKFPASFLPQEDQGYFMVSVQLPPSASLQRTEKAVGEVREVLASIPEVATYLNLSGFSLLDGGESSNSATFFVRLKPWSERKGKKQTVFAVIDRLNEGCATIEEAVVFAFNPSAIPGLGAGGGLEFELLDRNRLGAEKMQQAIAAIKEQIHTAPAIYMINTMFQGNSPQYYLQIDRDKIEMQGLLLSDVFATLSDYMGVAYVNDFEEFGRIYEVIITANTLSKSSIDNLLHLAVRNDKKQMVPFSSFTQIEEVLGMNLISRYNMYTSAAITFIPSPFYSSQQTIDQVEELFDRVVGDDFDYAWTSVAYQEQQANNTVVLLFALAIFVAFLVLAAQYESWTSSIAVLLGLPFAILGALLGCVVLSLPISLYSQIGIVLLIALSAKNAILIVEFASDYRRSGKSIVEAASEAGRVRLRPILMTSFAFILGVMPLVFASGAGAQSRIALGATVVFGMAVNVLLGTFFIPSFYYLMQSLSERISPLTPSSDEEAMV